MTTATLTIKEILEKLDAAKARRLALLTKAGHRPADGTAKRAEFEKLGEEIDSLNNAWYEARKAEKAAA